MNPRGTSAIASVLAAAGMAIASVGGSAATAAGQVGLFAQAAERSAPTPATAVSTPAQAGVRKRFISPGRPARPDRVRPRSTGSHKQNRRRALAGR